ncbi:MAG: DUF934 domain-containing protein [Proteobacteria bacterium]|nr:DUF934 domain-containing protein [Pseudomonadota bacterium]HQR04319.1 DUF934 domain-containing protein [Rhodocyclaceae bacterium]
MPKLIKQRRVVEDSWQTLFLQPGEEPETMIIPPGPVLVPLAVWELQRLELRERNDPVGVWLGPEDEPAVIADDLVYLPVIAVRFPHFKDGRGYSTAALLRRRYGYTGELRAIGDVLRDQMFYLHRVGFDAFEPRADRCIEGALAALDDFSVTYQGAHVQDQPLFRRRAA